LVNLIEKRKEDRFKKDKVRVPQIKEASSNKIFLNLKSLKALL